VRNESYGFINVIAVELSAGGEFCLDDFEDGYWAGTPEQVDETLELVEFRVFISDIIHSDFVVLAVI
jgi:hypothetical protein